MVRTKRIKHQKRKVYRRKTRGGHIPPYLKDKKLPNPHLPPHLKDKKLPPLPEVLNPSPEHSPIHVSPHPPSPLFRRPSQSPPKSRPTSNTFTRRAKKPGNLRTTQAAKFNAELRKINSILASSATSKPHYDQAELDKMLEEYKE